MNYNVRVGPTYVYVQKYINVHVCFFSDNVMIEHRNVFKNAVKKMLSGQGTDKGVLVPCLVISKTVDTLL